MATKKRDPAEELDADVDLHLKIMHIWASFALEHDMSFFTLRHMEKIADWTNDALRLLQAKDEEIARLRMQTKEGGGGHAMA